MLKNKDKNNLLYQAVPLTALSLVLTGCWGSSDDTDELVIDPPVFEKTLNLSGKAIDGYIVGGTVFLDINGNGVADVDEPQKLSQDEGDYQLEIPEAHAECVAYSALIVDVPAGAMDLGNSELGIEPFEITEPYQIVLQPSLQPVTEQDFADGLRRDISPLTTLVWQAIERHFPAYTENDNTDPNDASTNVKHCHYLREHQELVDDLKHEISSATSELVSFYNLSAEQIYSDFIENEDTEAYLVAQDIMKGLRAAYKRKIELRDLYPDAHEVSVFVYRDKELDQLNQVEDGWYRMEDVRLENQDLINTYKLTEAEGLDSIEFPVSLYHEVGQSWNESSKNGWLNVRNDVVRHYDAAADQHYYTCATIERISFTVDQVHYELGNSSDVNQRFATSDECDEQGRGELYERNYHLSYKEADTYYSADFFFRQAQARFGDLNDWQGVGTTTELSPDVMIERLSAMPYKWGQEVDIDTAYWRKRKEFDKIMIEVDNDDNWLKTSLNDDGTKTFECSSDGEVWVTCAD